MWILAAFIAVPLIEIALFIQVGGLIGLWPTLLIVVVTAIAGTAMVRSRGAHALAELKGSLRDLRDPAEPLAKGAMVLFSGALLLTPGFFTDAVGFALLVPAVQKRVFKELRARVRVETMTYGDPRRPQGPDGPGGARTRRDPGRPGLDGVIEGEAQEVDIPEPDPNRAPSGWTRRDGSARPRRD